MLGRNPFEVGEWAKHMLPILEPFNTALMPDRKQSTTASPLILCSEFDENEKERHTEHDT